jgi:predicted component of type VI protein secretion system
MDTLTEAMKRSLGRVRLRAIPPTSFASSDGGAAPYAEIIPPGAVVGRGEEADVRVNDEDGYMSRLHAIIQPQELHWVISDQSAHGTRLQGSGKRLDLPPLVPVPIVTGDEVILARMARFSIEIIVSPPTGDRTKDAPPKGTLAYIADPEILRLADELLRPRREDPQVRTAPSVDDLSDVFHVHPRTIYLRLDKLKALDPIRRQISARRAPISQIADAVAVAYPYLARPRTRP